MSTRSGAPPLGTRLVGVSLKMYFDVPQTLAYLSAVNDIFAKPAIEDSTTDASSSDRHDSEDSMTLFIIPSFPLLAHPTTQQLISSQANSATSPNSRRRRSSPHILLGAQNTHDADRGAYTGEVSPLMLSQLGVSIVEIGHAERRAEPFHEDEAWIANKVRGAVRNGMIPLVCVGEKRREHGVMGAVKECESQVLGAVKAVVAEQHQTASGSHEYQASPCPGIVFAYEPVWAIGASEPASAEHVLAVIAELRRSVLRELSSSSSSSSPSGPPPPPSEAVRFLYGGSAGPGTWEKLKTGCDGLFLGRFAHNVDNLVKVWAEVAAP